MIVTSLKFIKKKKLIDKSFVYDIKFILIIYFVYLNLSNTNLLHNHTKLFNNPTLLSSSSQLIYLYHFVIIQCLMPLKACILDYIPNPCDLLLLLLGLTILYMLLFFVKLSYV